MNKYSFSDILSKEILIEEPKNNEESGRSIVFQKIEIPMIQRDYALGRTNETEVRKRFLNSIFGALESGLTLDMNFVYGSVWESEDKKDNAFIPLDGQQRLTTLFLLYWYIGLRELDNSNRSELKKLLLKFTYATRTSSRRFCVKLVEVTDAIDGLPKEGIPNLSWYFKSYDKDPTIKSMLNMLDAIHIKYNERKNVENLLFPNLQKLQFYVLPLNGFNLSEELYIKMNARGKQLTDFENIKADLIKWMRDEKNGEFHQEVMLNDRKMPYYLAFSEKLDTKWTNFLWSITRDYDINKKDEKAGNLIYPDGKIVDPLFMRFFYRYLSNIYVLTSGFDNENIGKQEDFKLLFSEKKYQDFEIFKSLFAKEKAVLEYDRIMDQLSLNWESINQAIQSPWGDTFDIFNVSVTQSQRVVFLAITVYLSQFDYDERPFKQWMRVVRNVVENTDINDIGTMASAIKVIHGLSPKANCIYEYLATAEIQVSSSKDTLKEEIEKASFIYQDEEWENIFVEAESHLFFKGCVGFIMTPGMSKSEFVHRKEMAFLVFDERGVNEQYRTDHIFLRALISRFKDWTNIISKSFTDRDEGEHYLKKMLATNENVRNLTRELFSLKDEGLLNESLQNSLSQPSQMNGWDVNDDLTKKQVRKAHEFLYITPQLQNWMELKRAFRISLRDNNVYVSRPSSWYNWIMIGSFRNEIIQLLITNEGFVTANQCKTLIDEKEILIPFFWGSDSIIVEGILNNESIRFVFDKSNKTKVERNVSNDWVIIKEYNYQAEIADINGIESFIEKVKNEVIIMNSIHASIT